MAAVSRTKAAGIALTLGCGTVHTEARSGQDRLVQVMKGLNVIAKMGATSGISVHAHHLLHMLVERGCPVAVYNVEQAESDGRGDGRFRELTVDRPVELPYDVTLFVLDMRALFAFLSTHTGFVHDTERLNAGLIPWELTVLPRVWVKALRAMDVVLTPSDFVRGTYDAFLESTFTVNAPCPVVARDHLVANRESFALPVDAVLFVLSFDVGSDVDRKNPFAAIEAFRKAFPMGGKVALVIKVVNHRPQNQAARRALERLRESTSGVAGVYVIDQFMSYEQVCSLYAMCDVYVSLHRAEGLGLGLMEAMSLGKPVIATAWSGNMSYMNHTNACLVKYDLVKVKSEARNFRKGFLGPQAVWADADEGHAAEWMRRLADNGELRNCIGKKASASMHRYNQQAREATFVSELENIWKQRRFLPRHANPFLVRVGELRWAARAENPTLRGMVVGRLEKLYRRHIAWRFRSVSLKAS